MEYSKLYRTLQTGIRELSDEEVSELLSFIEIERATRLHMANYDPAKDVFLKGLDQLNADPGLAEQSEDILYGKVEPIEPTNEHSS